MSSQPGRGRPFQGRPFRRTCAMRSWSARPSMPATPPTTKAGGRAHQALRAHGGLSSLPNGGRRGAGRRRRRRQPLGVRRRGPAGAEEHQGYRLTACSRPRRRLLRPRHGRRAAAGRAAGRRGPAGLQPAPRRPARGEADRGQAFRLGPARGSAWTPCSSALTACCPCDMTRAIAKGADFLPRRPESAVMVFADISRSTTRRDAETGRSGRRSPRPCARPGARRGRQGLADLAA